MQDGDISSIEFHKVLQEVKNIANLRLILETKPKAKVRHITKEQREESLKQERKKGKETFLRKIANTSDIKGSSAI